MSPLEKSIYVTRWQSLDSWSCSPNAPCMSSLFPTRESRAHGQGFLLVAIYGSYKPIYTPKKLNMVHQTKPEPFRSTNSLLDRSWQSFMSTFQGSLPRSKDISGVALRCNSFENPNGWGPQIAQTAHLSLPQICPFFAAILGQHPSQLGGW